MHEALDVRYLGDWLAGSGLRLAIILVACLVSARLAWVIIARAERAIAARGLDHARRARTIGIALRNIVGGAVAFIGIALGLREIGLDIGPILAGAGVAGLAIGFGAQTLVRDMIAGVFILSEDKFDVGDVIEGAGVSGTVEDMSLRTTTLRDANGNMHVIPNGEFKVITNTSRGFHAAQVDVGVAYGEDVERALDVLRREMRTLSAETLLSPVLLGPIEVQGVDGFRDLQYVVRVQALCQPRAHREVYRAVAARALMAFHREGIRMRSAPVAGTE